MSCKPPLCHGVADEDSTTPSPCLYLFRATRLLLAGKTSGSTAPASPRHPTMQGSFKTNRSCTAEKRCQSLAVLLTEVLTRFCGSCASSRRSWLQHGVRRHGLRNADTDTAFRSVARLYSLNTCACRATIRASAIPGWSANKDLAHGCIIRLMPYVLYKCGVSKQISDVCNVDSRVMFRGFASHRTYT